jgi:hypothetical protein
MEKYTPIGYPEIRHAQVLAHRSQRRGENHPAADLGRETHGGQGCGEGAGTSCLPRYCEQPHQLTTLAGLGVNSRKFSGDKSGGDMDGGSRTGKDESWCPYNSIPPS